MEKIHVELKARGWAYRSNSRILREKASENGGRDRETGLGTKNGSPVIRLLFTMAIVVWNLSRVEPSS